VTRHQTVLFRQLLLLGDVLVSAGAFVGALYVREWLPRLAPYLPGTLGETARELGTVLGVTGYNSVLLGMLPIWALVSYYSHTPDFRAGYGRLAFRFARAVGLGLAVLVAASFWLKLGFLSRAFVFIFGATQFTALLLGRVVFMEVIKRSKKVDDHRVLVVGGGQRAVQFANALLERAAWNNRFIGFVSVPEEKPLAEAQPVLGVVANLARILDTEVVDEVVFAVPGSSPEDFADALRACDERGVDVLISMPPSVPAHGRMEIANVTGFSMPMIGLTRTPTGEVRLIVKRLVDVVGALVGIVLTGPIMLAAAIAVKLEDGGPILFTQVRSGRNGRKFVMLKFRSMCIDAEKKLEGLKHLNERDGPAFKITHDPRITRVGRFIRKTSIDELPQLFNVFVGHMSLVGPRPPLPSEVAQYEPWQRRRLSVRPGITGMWQVSGRNANVDFDEWMQLDLKYIDTWSLWLDVKILFKTLPAVLLHKGAS
jgi:exopolysaccharide biosynthesis polyprenyl glycosylphosphotransferase